jgi:hypothetical protein
MWHCKAYRVLRDVGAGEAAWPSRLDYRAAPVRPTACRDPVVEIDIFIVDGVYGGGHESL